MVADADPRDVADADPAACRLMPGYDDRWSQLANAPRQSRQRHAPVTAGLKARCASLTRWPDGSRHGFGSRPGRWAARKAERRAAATYPPRRTGPTRVGMRARPRDRSARRHLAGDGTSVKPEQSLDRRPVCQRFGAQAAGMAWDPVTDPAHPPFNAGAQRKRPSRRAGP